VVDASVSALLAHTSSIHEREQAGADVEVGRHAWALCDWWQRRGSGASWSTGGRVEQLGLLPDVGLLEMKNEMGRRGKGGASQASAAGLQRRVGPAKSWATWLGEK
jgi:hypothetical protein